MVRVSTSKPGRGDPDGTPLDVIVHHHEGYLRELEFVSYAGPEHEHFDIPAPDQVELFGWDEDEPERFGFKSRFDA